MDNVKIFFEYFGYLSSTIVIFSLISGFILWSKGTLKVLYRLGKRLAISKVAIFAKGDNLTSLKGLLDDTGLFDKKNIGEIVQKGDIENAKDFSIFLVYWSDWESDYESILSQKSKKTALIIYHPSEKDPIKPEQMKRLNEKRNVFVVRFRGRLLNDILISMITRGIG